jgi:hypothetical protein
MCGKYVEKLIDAVKRAEFSYTITVKTLHFIWRISFGYASFFYLYKK